jgi:hypothetical protein
VAGLAAINHVVVLMLENRSMYHMLGYLYAGAGNASPNGDPFEGLTGERSSERHAPIRIKAEASRVRTATANFRIAARPRHWTGVKFRRASRDQTFNWLTPSFLVPGRAGPL